MLSNDILMTENLIVPDSSKLGNTHNQFENKKTKQISGRKFHFFTWNNYDSTDIPILLDTLEQYCVKWVFQEEIGILGTPHLQGIIECKIKMRDTEFCLPKTIHWEKPKDLQACWKYCCKEETRAGKVYTKNYVVAERIITTCPNTEWAYHLIEISKSSPSKRKVYWRWSVEGGVGKSDFQKYMVVEHNCLFLSSGKYADIINLIFNSDMNKCNTICINIPKGHGNKISYSAIESLKDGMICNTKYETGTKIFNPKHVFVFANCPPDLDQMSYDRWDVKEIEREDSFNFNTLPKLFGSN